MSDRMMRIAIGVFVLVALGLLGTLIVLFGSTSASSTKAPIAIRMARSVMVAPGGQTVGWLK